MEEDINMQDYVLSSTHVRASNVIRRDRYDASVESEAMDNADPDEVQSVPASNSARIRSQISNEIDESLRNVMRKVDDDIRQCVSRGQPLISIFGSPPGRARRHRLPFEHTTASSNVGRVQQRQLPRGCSSRGPPSPGSLRWLDTPHAVSVSRGMSGTQQLMLFDHDARVRQAYRRAQWMNQAQRFRIALDMSDPKVQQTMQLAEQPFDFQVGGRAPPVHIAGIDPDEEDDELQEISS